MYNNQKAYGVLAIGNVESIQFALAMCTLSANKMLKKWSRQGVSNK